MILPENEKIKKKIIVLSLVLSIICIVITFCGLYVIIIRIMFVNICRLFELKCR